MEPQPQNLRIPNRKKKKARGASKTRRGLKGSLLLEEISSNYKVIYKSGKLFLGTILFFGADDRVANLLIVLSNSKFQNRLLLVEELLIFSRAVQRCG